MPIPLDAPEVLNREFLEVRARILQIAASLDRLDRASGETDDDPRVEKLQRALAVLAEAGPDRAEEIQLIFSRQYERDWRSKFKIER
jgi:hypothetical protein